MPCAAGPGVQILPALKSFSTSKYCKDSEHLDLIIFDEVNVAKYYAATVLSTEKSFLPLSFCDRFSKLLHSILIA